VITDDTTPALPPATKLVILFNEFLLIKVKGGIRKIKTLRGANTGERKGKNNLSSLAGLTRVEGGGVWGGEGVVERVEA